MQKMSEEIRAQIAQDLGTAEGIINGWAYNFMAVEDIDVGSLINDLTSVIHLLTCSRSILEDSDGSTATQKGTGDA
jgi:hypothetical protein